MTVRTPLRVYIAVISAASVAGVVTLPMPGSWDRPWMLLCLVMASALAGAWPVQFKSLTVRFTVTHPLIFCALGMLGPYAAVLSAVAGVAGATAAKGVRAFDIRLPFNIAAQALSAVAASRVFFGTGGYSGAGVVQLLVPLGLAAAAYFLISSGLVSVAIALEKGDSIVGTWKKTFSWSAVSYTTGWTFAVCLICLLEALGPMGVVLGIPPCWMLISFYRTHSEKLAEQASHIREVEGLNEVLENKVAERTMELKGAMDRIEEANRTLQTTNEELTAANKTKSEFLAAVSHELRTPLNAIIGFSELISDPCYGTLGPQQEEFLKAIHDSGEHLLILINDILDLSKIEAGKMEAHKCSTDLAATIHEAASMLRPEAGTKRIALTEECRLDDARGMVDPGMFREVIINLLSNAVKFTPEEGEVAVRAKRDGRDLVIEVEDNGIGISAEHTQNVFQEFFQVDGSYSRKYGGTGLGLALVKKMMELHGGTISVRSVPGEGSSFTCRYPDCIQEPFDTAVLHEAEESAGQRTSVDGQTILVVDDDALDRRLACNALKARGFVVVEAADGMAALDLIAGHTPDLVLVSENLSGTSGSEIVRFVRTCPATRKTPVVALTGRNGDSDRCIRAESEYSGTISKPIRISKFASQVAEFVDAEENVA